MLRLADEHGEPPREPSKADDCGESPRMTLHRDQTLQKSRHSPRRPVVPGAPSTAFSSGLSVHRGRAILLPLGANHARPFTARRYGRRQSGRRKHASRPTGSPARCGISAFSAFRVRRSHRRR
jgi:hypothetical protein